MRALMSWLRDKGTTLLIVTHEMDDVALLADRAIVLNDGKICAAGTPCEIFTAAYNAGDAQPRWGLGAPAALRFGRLLAQRGYQGAQKAMTLDELANIIIQEVSCGTAR